MSLFQIQNEPVTLRGLRKTRDVTTDETNISARVHHDFIMIALCFLHGLHDESCSDQGLEPVTSLSLRETCAVSGSQRSISSQF